MIGLCLILYYIVTEAYMGSENNDRGLKITFDSLNKELDNCTVKSMLRNVNKSNSLLQGFSLLFL